MAGSGLDGRIVCVTGGTGALGRAVVERLVAAGARCFVPAHEAGPSGLPDGVHLIRDIDLTDETAVERFYEQVAKEGAPWASIHCAGGFAMGPVEETSAAQFRKQFELNALSAFLCCREAIRHMRSAGEGGRIVNVAARPALEPRTGAGLAAYTASKAALAALTQALAQEVAEDGIWVNAIVPSTFDTPANREGMPDADFDQWPKPADLAESIAFLASPLNRSTRGALVPVYGRS